MKSPTKKEILANREHLVYDNGYGMTTDIYLLPVGAKFLVRNGGWHGTIIQKNNEKYLLVTETKKEVKIKEDRDYELSIIIIYNPQQKHT